MVREVRIYNTLSRKIEIFKPQKEGEVRMYVCGLTPYDYAHIGHARTSVFFDVFRRFLSYIGYKVKYVQNFTDVDDKIISRAIKEGKTYKEISQKYEKAYIEDLRSLNVIAPDVMPRVSEHIKEIDDLISKLKEKGIAYEISDGIYFHVPHFRDYGKLSHQTLEELNKHRIEVNPEKKDVKDFALWKFPKDEDYKAGTVFDSKCCGKGRPGWHIECSAMSMKYLGETLDIHGGGKDLIFPHHENEIAQSESATGKPFARYWMHVHFVNIKGEKMSKSLQNFIRIKDALKEYAPSTLRLFLLSAHYRKDIDFNSEIMENTRALDREIRRAIGIMLFEINTKNAYLERSQKRREELHQKIEEIKENFINALADDVHTEKAIMLLKKLMDLFVNALQDYAKENKEMEAPVLHHFYDTFAIMNDILGIYSDNMLKIKIPSEDLELVKRREELREKRKFKEADEIREELHNKGYVVEDFYRKTIIYPKHLIEI